MAGCIWIESCRSSKHKTAANRIQINILTQFRSSDILVSVFFFFIIIMELKKAVLFEDEWISCELDRWAPVRYVN